MYCIALCIVLFCVLYCIVYCRVNQGFDVVFVFDFGDGFVSKVNGVPGNFDPGSKVENVEKVYNKCESIFISFQLSICSFILKVIKV